MISKGMARLAGLIRRRPLVSFFILTCGFSWAYWIPLALLAPHLSHFPGLLGPLLAAVVMTAIEEGQAGLRNVLARALRWRVPLKSYGVALAPLVAGVLALGALAIAGDGWPARSELSILPGVPNVGLIGLFVVLLIVNGYGEETGWRGYAWPHLRQRHGFGPAAFVLAVSWALWHIPIFWLDTGLANMPIAIIPGWLLSLLFGVVVLGWLYEHSRSSIWIVALFHANLNWASATAATEGMPAMIVSILVIVGGSAILLHTWIRHGRPDESHKAAPPLS